MNSLLSLHHSYLTVAAVAAEAEAEADAAFVAERNTYCRKADAGKVFYAADWEVGVPEAERGVFVAAVDAHCAAVLALEAADARANSAAKARGAAHAALFSALEDASWGSQPDGSFVTRRTALGGWRVVTTLHAPRKGGPLAVLDERSECGGSERLTTYSVGEAATIRAAERAVNRGNELIRSADRAEAVRLLQSGIVPDFTDGQEGGFFTLKSGNRVSARGALRAAGFASIAEARREAPIRARR